MKHIKTYEDIETNNSKMQRLSNAFVNFFNSINNKILNCNFVQYSSRYGSYDYVIMNYDRSLINLSISNNDMIRIVFLFDINIYFSKEEINNMKMFISEEEYVPIEDLDNITDKLTKEKYEDFLIELKAKKYNI